MAALTAASWTVTVKKRGINPELRQRYTEGTIALAGTDTYVTGGVPLPAKGVFGFVREMDDLKLVGEDGATTQYLTNYNKTDHTMLMYVSHDTAGVTTLPLDEEDSAGVPGARTWNFVAQGW